MLFRDCCSLFDVGCRLLVVVYCVLYIVCCLVFVVCCWLLGVCWLIVDGWCSLYTARWLLLGVFVGSYALADACCL